MVRLNRVTGPQHHITYGFAAFQNGTNDDWTLWVLLIIYRWSKRPPYPPKFEMHPPSILQTAIEREDHSGFAGTIH